MRTIALGLVLVLAASWLGFPSSARAEDVAAEELLRLGIPTAPRGYPEGRSGATGVGEPLLRIVDAVRANLVEGGGLEVAVLAHTTWASPDDDSDSASSLIVYRHVQRRWAVWTQLELAWPGWADLARLDARVLEAGARPRLVVTYSSGGSFGGEVVDVYAQAPAGWRRTRSPTAISYGLKDVDGDGVWELLEGLLLPAAADLPSKARRRLWWWVLRYRDGRILDCSQAFGGFYAERLRDVSARLHRLTGGGGEPFERRLRCHYLVVYADERQRLRRLIAGEDPFCTGQAPFGGPVRPTD